MKRTLVVLYALALSGCAETIQQAAQQMRKRRLQNAPLTTRRRQKVNWFPNGYGREIARTPLPN
jgi:hypothetical protein